VPRQVLVIIYFYNETAFRVPIRTDRSITVDDEAAAWKPRTVVFLDSRNVAARMLSKGVICLLFGFCTLKYLNWCYWGAGKQLEDTDSRYFEDLVLDGIKGEDGYGMVL